MKPSGAEGAQRSGSKKPEYMKARQARNFFFYKDR